jgi:hypothetical protein
MEERKKESCRFSKLDSSEMLEYLYKTFHYPENDIKAILAEKNKTFDEAIEILKARFKSDI